MHKLLIYCFVITPLLLITHKFYLSVTDIEYNRTEKAVQIITRVFYDDFEDALNERYDEDLVIDETSAQDEIDAYSKKYLAKKLQIAINGELKSFNYIGKEYDDDQVVFYLEIPEVDVIHTIEIDNQVLMDAFDDQKNMIHTKINGKKKSFVFVRGNANAVLNF